ncbi:BOP1NT domain-containing protein [Ditylenchus destructor]|nr:BOP1NT domain-containing protein [Ditylenchus destructor]
MAKRTVTIDHYDSSDEEDLRNTIGNVPVTWYDDYDHIGYNLSGEKIVKSENAKKKDEIDTFLDKMEDPDYWKRVYDRQAGADAVLSEEQVQQLEAVVENRYTKIGYNPYEPFVDIFSWKKEIHPISNQPEHKRSFIPSLDERKKVSRMVYAIKMGWTKKQQKEEEPKVYDLWASDDNEQKSKAELSRMRMHLPAPKVTLPTNKESYNPPAEHLFDEDELEKWKKTEAEKRRIGFVPQKYDALRKVPFYPEFYKERLDRCMDLYLAPRQRKMRLNVDINELLPELPNPKDLQPFPTVLAFYMRGHRGQVRSLSVEPEKGELLISGGDDKTVRVWYIPTGKCLKVFKMESPVTCVAFCPNSQRTLILVSCESNKVSLLNSESGDKLLVSGTKQFISSLQAEVDDAPGNNHASWSFPKSDSGPSIRLDLEAVNKVRNVVWHKKGDYFATVGFESTSNAVLIHQLSKCASQKPFSKKKGAVQQVLFHPTKPWFFVATQQHVRIYDLQKCELKRKLFTGSKFVSCMDLHPHGNNLFIGGLDRVFTWLDMELAAKPWKTMKNHSGAIRSLCYHQRYPLLATVSDDATAIVYHAKVSNDLMRDNELVPVKRLYVHSADKLAILSSVFHPTQPWLITAGADGQIGLFSY